MPASRRPARPLTIALVLFAASCLSLAACAEPGPTGSDADAGGETAVTQSGSGEPTSNAGEATPSGSDEPASESSPAIVNGTPVEGASIRPVAQPTPGCAPVTEDILDILMTDLATAGVTLVASAAYPAAVTNEVRGVWEFIATRLQTGDGQAVDATFLSATYLLDLSWSSTIDQEIRVYAVDEAAQANSSLPPPSEDEIKRTVSPDEPEAEAARACLAGS
jgi:hypothetical protein